MIVEVETATGQRIPRSSLGAASTIRDLANALMHNVPANEEMVTCVHRGTTTPFFYCHGDFLTRGFYGLRLGQLLGPDQPVYLLHPPPLSKLRSNTSIEAIAESYVPHLLAAQPNGAFRLGGFCNGGLLAWEIARQLFGKNRQVELVVIIDTISLNARPTFRALERTLRALKSFAPALKHDMCAIWKWARQNDRIDPLGARADGAALRIHWHVEAYQYAAAIFPFMCHYIPQKIDCEVYCVLCEEYQVKKEYSPSAWQQIAGVVHRKYIPGAHHNCVTTHLDSLAKVLRGILPSPAIERGTRSRFGRS